VANAQQQRYLTLDALRGVAALAVVVVHVPMVLGLPQQVSSGLAVDLFFILSGFVVEHAYGDHLRHEMTFSRFITVRMIRLYPLYVVGLTVYALFFLASLRAVDLGPFGRTLDFKVSSESLAVSPVPLSPALPLFAAALLALGIVGYVRRAKDATPAHGQAY
jgi:peptidoglycan/LPS O-acetylase OafA/YrhL